MKGKTEMGRLAMRAEGEWWNAYYAMPDTMTDAIHLGSIRLSAAQRPAIKQGFMDLMRAVVADILEEAVGTRPTWGGEHSAPEHEKSGNA